jgi:hypothetical protein
LKISAIANSLSEEEKLALINLHIKNYKENVALNITPGFGVGSFKQGDTIGGTLTMLTELGSIGLIIPLINTEHFLS